MTLKFTYKLAGWLLLLFFLVLLPAVAAAQSRQVLSVTPTLFDMTAQRGEVWRSQLKIVNANPFSLRVFITPVNFEPKGEQGEPLFLSNDNLVDNLTLAEWIEVSSPAVELDAEDSAVVPFVINIPEDAAPGGHFAAFLVGTEPPTREGSNLNIQTSQVVTSLVFLSLAGEVIEAGKIREFAVAEKFVNSPRADFSLRFVNKGNVHLKPQGDITIFNMYGKQRGYIPINHKSHFGNVLPDSIRKFNFSWEGEASLTDIGRYKAVATLAYGGTADQYDSRVAYFWVIPVKAVTLTLGALLLIIFILQWAIRAYVRRMLALAGIDPDQEAAKDAATVKVSTYSKLAAPWRTGLEDFKDHLDTNQTAPSLFRSILNFAKDYRRFFLAIVALVLIAGLLSYFFQDVGSEEKAYDVKFDSSAGEVSINSEELAFRELLEKNGLINEVDNTGTSTPIKVVNTSGQPGSAAAVAIKLVAAGYEVETVAYEEGRVNNRTAVVYDLPAQETALKLSQEILNGVLVSPRPGTASSSEPTITVYVGREAVSN